MAYSDIVHTKITFRVAVKEPAGYHEPGPVRRLHHPAREVLLGLRHRPLPVPALRLTVVDVEVVQALPVPALPAENRELPSFLEHGRAVSGHVVGQVVPAGP